MVTLTCLRSHVRQCVTTLEALDAVLAEAEPGQLDEAALSQAAWDLAGVARRIETLVEHLAARCDPQAATE
jgi:hypothetical protein